MENFRMYVPTDIRFGKNRLTELEEVLLKYGNRVLLVYGGGSIKKTGLYDEIMTKLGKDKFHVVELSGINPNPRIDSVREGIRLVREEKLEVILAVGGGSVVDAAKVIAGGVYYEGDAWDLVVDSEKMGNAIPIVDILTLAATGTEMNRNAVISNPETQEKLGTSGWELIPKVSFLDPTITFTVPPVQTSAGIADTLSHLFEQYFNRTEGNDVQNFLSEGLMQAVIKNSPVVLQDPENYDARANLLWASTLALNGLCSKGNSGAWSCHPIEHELSAYYDITHGIGLAIITPRWMKFCIDNDSSTHSKFALYGKNIWKLDGDNDEAIARKAVELTYHFFKDILSIPMTLSEVGIQSDALVNEMAKQAVLYGNLESGHYVPMSIENVEAVLLDCFMEMAEF